MLTDHFCANREGKSHTFLLLQNLLVLKEILLNYFVYMKKIVFAVSTNLFLT